MKLFEKLSELNKTNDWDKGVEILCRYNDEHDTIFRSGVWFVASLFLVSLFFIQGSLTLGAYATFMSVTIPIFPVLFLPLCINLTNRHIFTHPIHIDK